MASEPVRQGRPPMFQKLSDGTADFGKRYNALNGQLVVPPPRPEGTVVDTTAIPFSEEAAASTLHHFKAAALPPASTTFSYREWCTSRTKHIRGIHSPQDKYRNAITTAQELGWMQWELRKPMHGQRKCKETHIAEQQVLGARNIEPVCRTSRIHF